MVVSSDNYFASELTIEEIAAAFSAPEGATWDSVNPAFPAHPIQAFSPGADSGTFDYFNEVVYDEAEPSPILSAGVVEIVGEDDNITVRGVSEDGCTEGDLSTTCAIGYFGYAFFAENSDVLSAVAVDAGDGPVAPGDDSVNEGTYPIARPLFMYTAPSVIAEKPQVAEFIAYYLNNVNSLISEVGYFPAPASALQEAADNINAAGFGAAPTETTEAPGDAMTALGLPMIDPLDVACRRHRYCWFVDGVPAFGGCHQSVD